MSLWWRNEREEREMSRVFGFESTAIKCVRERGEYHEGSNEGGIWRINVIIFFYSLG